MILRLKDRYKLDQTKVYQTMLFKCNFIAVTDGIICK
jgi:hypothetical protein